MLTLMLTMVLYRLPVLILPMWKPTDGHQRPAQQKEARDFEAVDDDDDHDDVDDDADVTVEADAAADVTVDADADGAVTVSSADKDDDDGKNEDDDANDHRPIEHFSLLVDVSFHHCPA